MTSPTLVPPDEMTLLKQQLLSQGTIDVRSEGTPRQKRTREEGVWAYWRKPSSHPSEPNFITKSPAWPVYHRHNDDKGFIKLRAYGEFTDVWDNGQEMFRFPWRRILLMGGAKEFPLEQIRELRWHRIPPVVHVNGQAITVTFPQIVLNQDGNIVHPEKGVLVDHFCPDCAERPSFATQLGLSKHQQVNHKTVAGNRHLAGELATAQARASEPTVQALLAGQESLRAQMDEQRRMNEALLAQLSEQQMMNRALLERLIGSDTRVYGSDGTLDPRVPPRRGPSKPPPPQWTDESTGTSPENKKE